MFYERVGLELEQKGYEFFSFINNNSLSGGVQDTYLLNTGDQITLVLQGGTNTILRQTITREGNIFFNFTDEYKCSYVNFKTKNLKKSNKSIGCGLAFW